VPGLTVRSIKGLEKDQAKFDDAVSKLSTVLQVYKTILGKQKYLAGDVSPASSTVSWATSQAYFQEFMLADLFHISFGTLLEPSGCDLLTSTGPNVAWCVVCWTQLTWPLLNAIRFLQVVERDPGMAIPVYLEEGYDNYEHGLVLSMVL
jgi:hypothetical protein